MNWKRLSLSNGVTTIKLVDAILVRRVTGEAVRTLVPEGYVPDALAHVLEGVGGWAFRAALDHDAEKHRQLRQWGAIELDHGRATLHLLPAAVPPSEGPRSEELKEELRRLRANPKLRAFARTAAGFLAFAVARELKAQGCLSVWMRGIEVHGTEAMHRLVMAMFAEEVA